MRYPRPASVPDAAPSGSVECCGRLILPASREGGLYSVPTTISGEPSAHGGRARGERRCADAQRCFRCAQKDVACGKRCCVPADTVKKDSKRPNEIPAPLCGLVFVRCAPENFDCTPLRSVAQVPAGDLRGSFDSFLLWIFRDIKFVCFLDSKTCYEIPAPLCGLVFVRVAPENFDALRLLRMTYSGECRANIA